jgi:hypothetical protein
MAVIVGGPNDYAQKFGPVQARTYDMGTVVAVSALQGANSYRCVRVTDGTDVSATHAMPGTENALAPAFYTALENAINSGVGVARTSSYIVRFSASTSTFTALYTGSVGNGVSIALSAGSKAGTFRAVVSVSSINVRSEVFDNIPFGSGTPTATSYTLSGGTDGATAITSAEMVGIDVSPRTGMYALRATGCAVAVLADLTDVTTWSVQSAFGFNEGVLMYVNGANGESITTATTNKQSAGVDDYSVAVFLGDYLYFQDQTNQVTRYVAPAGFAGGKRVALSPNDSVLNKQLFGIVGSNKEGVVGTGVLNTYTQADLEAMSLAGIDVICNPAPGGSYWACRIGHNSSSDPDIRSDSYTMMINFGAKSINGGMGQYVGLPNNITLQQRAKTTLLSMFSSWVTTGLISLQADGSVPYSVICDATNNPQTRTGVGYLTADCKVTFDGIVEEFFVNLEGGSTVVVGANSQTYVAQ